MKLWNVAAAAMSVILVPSLGSSGTPAAPTNQTRGVGSNVPAQTTAPRERRDKPDSVWVEGHSRSGVFVPGHWR